MELANHVGNVQRVFQLVKHLMKKPTPPPSNLTTDASGNMLTSPEDVVTVWFKFLAAKFAVTNREKDRGPLEPLPTSRTPADSLTRGEFENAVRRMPNQKAVGPAGVPIIEAYKYCDRIRDDLFDIIKEIWDKELVPANLSRAKQVYDALQEQRVEG